MEKLAPFLFSSLLLALCGFCSLSLVPFSHLSFHFSPSSIDFQEMVNAKSGRWIKLNAGFLSWFFVAFVFFDQLLCQCAFSVFGSCNSKKLFAVSPPKFRRSGRPWLYIKVRTWARLKEKEVVGLLCLISVWNSFYEVFFLSMGSINVKIWLSIFEFYDSSELSNFWLLRA